MKKIYLLTIALSFVLKVNCQIIDFYDKKLNCDSAYTTLELGWCSRFMLEQSINKYDSLIINFNKCLDTRIIEDKKDKDKMLMDDPKQTFEYYTDYSKIKVMFNQSDKIFREYAELERNITGEFYGWGRERSIGENLRQKQIYDNRIKELMNIIKKYCG